MSSTPPLGPTEQAVVDVLAKTPDMSFNLRKLAELTHCRANAVSRIMPNLKQLALVFRHSEDGESYWRLSDSARAAIKTKDAGKAEEEAEEPSPICKVCEDEAQRRETARPAGFIEITDHETGKVSLVPKNAEMMPAPRALEARTAANLLYRIEKLVREYGGTYAHDGLAITERRDLEKKVTSRIMLDIILEAPIV